MIVISTFGGCQSDSLSLTHSVQEEHTTYPTAIEPFATKEIFSDTPNSILEITYIINNEQIYAMELGCLEEIEPCISEANIIYTFSEEDKKIFRYINSMNWSPDGRKLAISASDGNWNDDIYVGDLSEGNWLNITDDRRHQKKVMWFPEEEKIFFTNEAFIPPFERVYSYMIDADGTNRYMLLSKLDIKKYFQITEAVIDPSGNHIAFVNKTSPVTNDMYITNLDGSYIRRININNIYFTDLSFSPEGSWVVSRGFPYNEKSRYIIDKPNLYLIDFEGHGKKEINFRENFEIGEPVWSPIGNWIIFTGSLNQGVSNDIYIIRPNGDSMVRVTSLSMSHCIFSWRLISK